MTSNISNGRSVDELAVGDFVNATTSFNITSANCERAHSGEVFATGTIDVASPHLPDREQLAAQGNTLCADRLVTYVGSEDRANRLTWVVHAPTDTERRVTSGRPDPWAGCSGLWVSTQAGGVDEGCVVTDLSSVLDSWQVLGEEE